MTIWPLILILKKRKGSLEVGKWADFVLFDKDIMKIEESEVFKMKPASTYGMGLFTSNVKFTNCLISF
jgi:predicted amidohydrolase YtcJ